MAEVKEPLVPERFFRSQLSAAYIHHEEQLLFHSNRPGKLDQVREDIDKTLSEVTERGIFKCVPDEDSRRSMRETALDAAKDFWIKKLEEPGLSANAAAFGRGRIIEITQGLEELAKSPDNPQ
ncbi:MAG: hypothetical protein V1808_01955 [Candidatus Daviesbacteria bacterium]